MSVTYNRVNWKDKQTALTTPMNAENLNRMDQGIKAATDAINTLTTDVVAIKILDNEEELPDPGEANTIYFIKQTT